ncbi:AAA family ATPase [Streptomyces aquilus]|uniref:helix-turn-helix transcriptional regulator n=1 Tax=Streptomyces aquilus TaxID=2548456 RepID=UPI0036A59B5C
MIFSAKARKGTGKTIRHSEFKQLTATLDQVAASRSGALVELIGDPGIGKSHLLSALASAAAERQIRTLNARCTHQDRTVHFAPFLQALATQGVRVGELARESQESHRESADSPAGNEPHPLYGFEELKQALIRQTAHGTLVLMLDDFHHADAHSIRLVEHLALAPVPDVLVVVSHRTRQASARLRDALAHGVGLGTVHRIQLHPVDLAQTAALLDLAPNDCLVHELCQESHGIPAYLLELARTRSKGDAPESMASGQQWSALMNELTPLTRQDSTVLSSAAVLGDLFDLEALSHVSGFTHEQVRESVGILMRADLIRMVDHPPSYSLRHPVVRSMLYAHSDPAWRIAAHRSALHLLNARGALVESKVFHLESLLGQFDPADTELFVRAAQEAIAVRPSCAVRWMQAAQRLSALSPRDHHSCLSLALTLARSLIAVARTGEARDVLRQTLATAPPVSTSDRTAVTTLYAQLEWLLGERANARSLLEAELRIAAEGGAQATVALIIAHQLVSGLYSDDQAFRHAARCVRLAQNLLDAVGEAGALALLASHEAYVGDYQAARATLDTCTSIVDQLADDELDGAIEYLTLLGWAQLGVERFTEARRQLQRADRLARAGARCHLLPMILLGLGRTYLASGPLEKARQAADEGLRLARDMGSQHLTALAIADQSACLMADEPGSARALELAETATATLPVDEPLWRVDCAMTLAEASLESGDPLRCTALILDVGHGPDLAALPRARRPDGFELLTRASLRVGDVAAADRWAARAACAADFTGLASHHATASAARAHVLTAQRQFDKALHFYRTAAELFAGIQMTRAQAQMLVSAASCAAAWDMLRDTAPMLALSKELARRSGASATFRRATEQQRLLEDTGGRPESGQDTDPLLSVLTTREYEIARIASTGKRTKEIAQQLNLSARTIETHLSHVYRKLGVSSRAALASLLARPARLHPGTG